MISRVYKLYSKRHYAVIKVYFKDKDYITLADSFIAEITICNIIDSYTWQEMRKNPTMIEDKLKQAGYHTEIQASMDREAYINAYITNPPLEPYYGLA